MYRFESITAHADGLAPTGATTSAGTVMTQFESFVPALEWLTQVGIFCSVLNLTYIS